MSVAVDLFEEIIFKDQFMAISDAKKRKIGRQLTDWVYLGIRTGARRAVARYRTEELAGNHAQAVAEITVAVNKPRRARARIDEWVRVYDLENGVGTAQPFLVSCLALAGSVLLSELNAELTLLENQADTLIANNQAGDTLDQMATAIENAFDWEAKDWAFPFPAGYTDIPLLDN